MSDLHGYLPEIPECDILLIVGDICPDYIGGRKMHWADFSSGKYKQTEWLRATFAPWLRNTPAKTRVGIAGNHDFVFEDPSLVPDLPWIYLRDSEATVEGLKVYGTPWVPNLPRWAFHADNRKLALAWDAVPDGIDILMTHGPPFGFGDKVLYMKPDETTPHVGDSLLAQALSRINAKLHVFGHIHEDRGIWYDGSRTMANVAVVDANYDPYKLDPMVFELPRPITE